MPRADYQCPTCKAIKEVVWSIKDGPPEDPVCHACSKELKDIEYTVWMHRIWEAPHIHVTEKIHVGNALGRSHDYTTKECDEMSASWPRTVGEREADEQRELNDQAKQLNAPIEVA